MESNRVSVKIYGQEYTIAGEKSREHIIRVANHVDVKIHEIAEALKAGPVSSLAVLAAVNIADEYFDSVEALQEERRLNERLRNDTEHYIRLWDEAKMSFAQYKEEAAAAFRRIDELKTALDEKEKEIERLNSAIGGAKVEAKEEAAAQIAETEARCKEMENSFFDLQMENIQLKSEIDSLKRKGGEF